MRRRSRLRGRSDFSRTFREGKSWPSRLLVVRAYPNGGPESRFGFTAARQIGNAVTRNRVKRRLRQACREAAFGPGWDVVIVARVAAASASYGDLCAALRQVMERSPLKGAAPVIVEPSA